MLRSTATRSMLKSFVKAPTARSSYSAASAKFHSANPNYLRQLTKTRPQVLTSINRPPTAALFYATKSDRPPYDYTDAKEESKIAKQKLEPDPNVSGESSVRHVFEKGQSGTDATNTHGGLRADIETIKETFSLAEVPKESLYIGAAGILPYAATSLSTVYLAFDINHARDHGTGYLFSPELAHQLLDMVTPIQIGYGAVIISFLGAIHWGMEYSGFGGHHSYRRYMYGVIAPAVAWPTMFMPVEYALMTQFFAFNFLYFADARATARGWFPAWYSIYRFVLTFFVGASIVVSLIGRGRIIKHEAHLKEPADYIKGDRDQQWIALEREERERRAKMIKADEDEEEAAEEAEDSDESDDSKDAKDASSDKKKEEKNDKESDDDSDSN